MRYYLFILSLFSLILIGCLTSNKTFRLEFVQEFDFGENHAVKDTSRRDTLTESLQLLLGKNWELLSYSDELIEKLYSKSIISKGQAEISISLVPHENPKKFFISGGGFFYIIDTGNNDNVLFDGRFSIIESIYYPPEILKTGSIIPVYFNQVLINQFQIDSTKKYEVYAFEPSESIQIDVGIKRINDKKNKPGLDYDKKAEVKIKETSLGTIKFMAPKSNFDEREDLGGIKLIRSYKE